jgi:hypothetical protein
MTARVTAFCLLLSAFWLAWAAEEPRVRPDAIRAHVAFLADDLLEGRGTGQRGYDLAAKYVATVLQSYGLEPGGVNSTFFQPVALRVITPEPARSLLLVSRRGERLDLVAERDYLVSPPVLSEEARVTAPLVFVAQGITAPERGYDDYRKIDARGKIVIVLSGAPASFPSPLRAHHSSTVEKARNAAAHGAVGMLSIRIPADESRDPWKRTVRNAGNPSMRALGRDGVPLDVPAELRASAQLSQEGAERLFAAAGRDYKKIRGDVKPERLKSFDLPLEATIHATGKHARIDSPNVAAILRGSDPRLQHEYLIYTAHLDHLGIGTPVDNDAIYNGAFDNASGSGSLLELARAFSALATPPRRSVMFLFVTAEEKGLLGSKYFATDPTVPIDRIVANLNLDMPLVLYPLREVIVLGAEHSSLGEVAAQAAQRMGLQMGPDPFPDQVFFVRSDQYSFIRRGVPALAVGPGLQSEVGMDVKKMVSEWMRTTYHSPKDDLSQRIDYEAGARLAQFYFLVGLNVANAEQRPTWNRGDFFGETFGKTRPSAAPAR